MNSALAFLHNQANVDSDKSAILCWSYTGESAILAQMSNSKINAVIGLSALGFSSGVYLGAEFEREIQLQKLQAPYLILTQQVRTNGGALKAPEIFPSMHPDSRYISFPNLTHGNFNAIEGMIPGILGTSKVQSWSRGGDVAKTGYEAICQITLFFVNSILKENDDFDENTEALRRVLPADFLTIISPKN